MPLRSYIWAFIRRCVDRVVLQSVGYGGDDDGGGCGRSSRIALKQQKRCKRMLAECQALTPINCWLTVSEEWQNGCPFHVTESDRDRGRRNWSIASSSLHLLNINLSLHSFKFSCLHGLSHAELSVCLALPLSVCLSVSLRYVMSLTLEAIKTLVIMKCVMSFTDRVNLLHTSELFGRFIFNC